MIRIKAAFRSKAVAFDMMRDGKRLPWDEVKVIVPACGFVLPRLIHDGGAFGVTAAKTLIEQSGHGVRDGELVEGAVWRVERKGVFDFMAKWVRPDKIDGKYLPEVSGQPAIWQWRPS